MSPAKARTRTARSVVERTNHEATTPPTFCLYFKVYLSSNLKNKHYNRKLRRKVTIIKSNFSLILGQLIRALINSTLAIYVDEDNYHDPLQEGLEE